MMKPKDIIPYLPFLFVGIAAVTGVYFLWYKPKRDAEKAAAAAAQAAHDNELLADNDRFSTGRLNAAILTSTPVLTSGQNILSL